ncbi:GH92 family glycosyl hydrolase [Schlesneria sp. DSM 10557]|uniref:GH92 family glycosyl hydrolase n=1 Tax=Schlesneria sp. DSM 10557 TaxID=3044399 RepID=UPI00359F6C2C
MNRSCDSCQHDSVITCVAVMACILEISRVVAGAGDEAAPAPLLKPAPAIEAGRLGRSVDPFIGTGGLFCLCGNNFPGATLPFGMVRLSPDTVSPFGARGTNTSGYFYSDPRILGFSHTRLAGTGATDGGNFLVLPYDSQQTKGIRRGLNTPFLHENEVAFPGYYGVSLHRLGILAELTSTCRVGIHRYTFARAQSPHLLMHVTSALGKGACRAGSVRILPETGEIEGSAEAHGTFSKRYGGLRVYFVARVNRPIRTFATWSGDAENQTVSTEIEGDDIGVDLEIDVDPTSRQVELKVGFSYVSLEGARQNLEQEAGNVNFDEALQRAVTEWEEKLGRIEVSGGSKSERTIFTTALYRAFQMPTTFSDVNGRYRGFDGQVHQADGFVYYTDLSLWDTFRTVHPLYNLIARDEQADMIKSLLKMAEQGGWLPRWPSGSGYTNSMLGTPADIMITEAYLKGIRDFDIQQAYAAMVKTAHAPVPPGSRFSGRVGIEHYLKYGYCPGDLMKKSVASTIEFSYADDAIARLAEALGKADDSRTFRERSHNYLKLWNPETRFFQPRDSHGGFQTFDPEMLTYVDFSGTMTHAYVEGSAWQWRWGIPPQATELVGLFPDPEAFVEQLDQFFSRSPSGVGITPNAYYWHGNQPDLFAPYLFNSAGRPDLTQKWVRWILANKYGTGANGLDGNDDGGTLSAWYVLSSLGLFPVAGTDRYELGTLLWNQAELKVGPHRLALQGKNEEAESLSVQTVRINDQPLDRHWIRHNEIERGGTLQFRRSTP